MLVDAEELGQIMSPKREPGDDAEAAPATAFEPPEQVRIGAGVGHPQLAIGGDNLGLQQARSGQSKGSEKLPNPPLESGPPHRP